MIDKLNTNTIIRQPADLKLADSAALSILAKEYPWFQAAQAVELKSLKVQNSFQYNQKLKTVAAHTVDRGVLFDFITSRNFKVTSVEAAKERSEIKSVKTTSEALAPIPLQQNTKDALQMTSEEANRIVDPALFEVKQATNKSVEIPNPPETVPEEPIKKPVAEIKKDAELLINAPLEFDKNERHSFSEWLKLTTIQPIDRSEEVSKKPENTPDIKVTPAPKLIESPLIEDFIKNSPRISPVKKDVPMVNLAIQNNAAEENLMTETLAKVYLAQNNYKKAIQAYKILSLKNPEKSGLFADQIRAIERLMQNR